MKIGFCYVWSKSKLFASIFRHFAKPQNVGRYILRNETHKKNRKMKKTAIIITLGIILVSCKNEKKAEGQVEAKTEVSNIETQKTNSTTTEINWDEMPDLKDIGDFPFITAPTGLKINNEKDGLSEVFDFETMEIYTGAEISTVEGKLGIVAFI